MTARAFTELDSLHGSQYDLDRVRTADQENVDRALALVPTIERKAKDGAGVGVVYGSDAYDPDTAWGQVMSGGPDVNPELMGRKKFPIYREMKLSDPAIRSLSWLYKLPIRSAEYGIVPAEDDPDGPEAAAARADFAAWQFGLERHNLPRLDLTWDKLLQLLLLYVDYGCMGAEMQWAAEPGNPSGVEEWTDIDGDTHLVAPLSRIAPRLPYTIDHVEFDPKTGRVDELVQDLPGVKPVPGDRVVWLNMEQEGNNYWGVSPLRAAWGPWTFKRSLMIGGVIAFDRYSAGIPQVNHPASDAAEKRAHQIGRSIRSHERAYVTFEGPDNSAVNDWGLKIVSGSSSIADPVEFMRYLDSQIAVCGLQQFAMLGQTHTGSRAVGEVLVEPFYMAVQAIAKEMMQEMMRSVLGALWKRNFPEGTPIPEIVCTKIQGRSIDKMTKAIADLATAGLTFTDRDTQDDIRDMLDLRHLPDPVKGPLGDVLETLPDEVGVTPAPPPTPIVSPGTLDRTKVPVEGGSVLPAPALA